MSEKLKSALYSGKVTHQRLRPKKHRFTYRVFSLCLDLDELELLHHRLRLFSVNCFNLFSFHEKDHGSGKSDLRGQITQLLTEHGFADATARIKLLCYPRILGYVFNPLSIYFCYNDQQQLSAVLYEVSNTFKQKHTYLIRVDSTRQNKLIEQQAEKAMYVSPFMPLATHYSFRISPPDQQQVSVFIRQSDDQTGKPGNHVLLATFNGKHRIFNDATLLKLFFSHPLMTLKIIGAIHWQAIRLWLKGLPLQPRKTTKNARDLSWQDDDGVLHHERL
ncbi:DUF1365 domain-containing protein [Porticoccus sp.]|uniref:DUF1365 domain-containing protein n=1 Tax=Porticoccus sp. TaxID=2024853 RepID=UPI003F69C58E